MPSSANSPRRGEVWGVDLDPTRGREQAGIRPALIVSDDALNGGPRDLVIICPITGTDRGIPTHVPVAPPEGGLSRPSAIMVEQVRAVSTSRLGRRGGEVTPETMGQVDQVLGLVLNI
jgi:mRNA interferase MazF